MVRPHFETRPLEPQPELPYSAAAGTAADTEGHCTPHQTLQQAPHIDYLI